MLFAPEITASPARRPIKNAEIPIPIKAKPLAAFVLPTAETAIIAPSTVNAFMSIDIIISLNPRAAAFKDPKSKSIPISFIQLKAASPANSPPKKAGIATPIATRPAAPLRAALAIAATPSPPRPSIPPKPLPPLPPPDPPAPPFIPAIPAAIFFNSSVCSLSALASSLRCSVSSDSDFGGSILAILAMFSDITITSFFISSK